MGAFIEAIFEVILCMFFRDAAVEAGANPRFIFISIAVWALIWFVIALFIIHS
ncbi:MAG: hypothetical protein O7I42_13985 [Alphaproteobacteria bacterium]|nr:hypothetical protein [Alphaproteobacteria bacterium]